MASNTIRPRGAPAQPSMSTTTSPLRPPPPRKSPTASQSSPCPRAIASTASATASSYGRPLAVPRACSAATSEAFSRSDRSPASSSFSATICSRIASSCCSGARRRVPRRAQVRGLEVGQRIRPVGRRELAQQVLAHPRRLLGHHLLELVLDRGRRLLAEQPPQLLGQVPVLLAEDLVDLRAEELGDHPRLVRERALHLARDLLELVADELRVDRRLLALQHPRADLDRVRDDLDRVLARLDPAVDERRRRRIVDDDVVDKHTPHQDVDPRLAEGRSGFHDC